MKQRIKDAAVWMGFPGLRGDLHRAMDAGLETLLDYQRLAMIVAALKATESIEGEAIEFGTFRGGSAGVILQNLAEGKTLHVCDSFAGMPETTGEDNFHNKGDFAETGAEKVINGLASLGGNFKAHVGFFSDTIPKMKEDGPHKLSFAHIDADLYESVRDALEYCYPRMGKGAVIILDDYGAPSCLGAKQAADEFFDSKPETVVKLSQPAYGCVVGGGDALKLLLGSSKFPRAMTILGESILQRGDS